MSDGSLKIAVFHCGFAYSGGGERLVLEEVMGLRRLGHDVVCYAPTLDKEACYPDIIDIVGVKTFLPQLPRWFPLRDAIAMVLSSILAPVLALRFRDMDAFVGANQPGAWIAYCMAKVLRKPYVVYVNQPNRLIYPRGVDQETGWLTKRDYHVLNQIIQLIKPIVGLADKRSFTEASTMLTNGAYIAGIIESIYGRESEHCPAGCHPQPRSLLRTNPQSVYQGALFMDGIIIRRPYILITNRHEPQKKFEYVIDALAQVIKVVPEVSLVIPGPYTAHTPKLIELAEDLGIANSVFFLGQISEHQLQRLYREAAVYCYPAPEEDFGMGVIEAMAWGIPVVAWNNAGPTVTVVDGETGFLAEPFDVSSYAKSIERLLLHPDLRMEMGLAAHARVVDHFSWDRHASILEGAILEAVGELERARGRAPHRQTLPVAPPHLTMSEAEAARVDVETPR
jgi:glycosyltransferase involved in cell wall biosynthesis